MFHFGQIRSVNLQLNSTLNLHSKLLWKNDRNAKQRSERLHFQVGNLRTAGYKISLIAQPKGLKAFSLFSLVFSSLPFCFSKEPCFGT